MMNPSHLEVPAICLPCSEACAGFRRLPGPIISDYGLCENPRSPRHGCPVRLDRDCAYYLTAPDPSAPKEPRGTLRDR